MTAIADALVDQLRQLAPGTKPHLGDLRRAIAAELGSCSLGELQAAVQSLRFAGKLAWDKLELSASMRGPDDEDDYPGQVNDQQQSASPSALGASEALAKSAAAPGLRSPPPPAPPIEPGAEQTAAPVRTPGADPTSRVVQEGGGHSIPDRAAALQPSRLSQVSRGRRTAAVVAARRPVPAPRHESEVARAVREEATEVGARRRNAVSTATVSRPLAMLRSGDLSLAETVATLLAEDPHDLIVAINRRHKATWAAICNLSRSRNERPSVTLYAVLEAGLSALDPEAAEERKAA